MRLDYIESSPIALMPVNNVLRYTVEVETGLYRERVWINASLGPVTLRGLGATADAVLLVYHCCPQGNGTRRCSNATVDSSCSPQHPGAGMSRGVETLLIEADDFILANISVANDACGYDAGVAGQSETVQMLADRTFVSHARLYGAQDTVFNRQRYQPPVSGQHVHKRELRFYVWGIPDGV